MRRISRIYCGYLKNRQIYTTTNTGRYINTTALSSTPCLHLEKETIFQSLSNQQKRAYVPDTTAPANKECWNCKKDVTQTMICQHCKYIQDVNSNVNYFELLDFPQSFELETSSLTKRFRQLQSLVHPDKFSNKSSREQINSADWSSLINKAYKTLLIPIDRGQYLLQLNGRQIPQDNSALDKEFLMEMMERNEEVDEANTKNELEEIHERLSQELQEKVQNLTKSFGSNDLEKATAVLVEMKYLLSIQKTIKNKLQSLMGS
ncbi:iron-sulfur cluster co-chaperone protein HscB-like protein, mitochondrial [Haematobia irritans]|uniref:iron-sulfur cluster co-chaperone protein HscB-like protein, mitochondrial n=1 Tax=Haematobia irritans TaxID=7368 RepID=UPI003F4F9092